MSQTQRKIINKRNSNSLTPIFETASLEIQQTDQITQTSNQKLDPKQNNELQLKQLDNYNQYYYKQQLNSTTMHKKQMSDIVSRNKGLSVYTQSSQSPDSTQIKLSQIGSNNNSSKKQESQVTIDTQASQLSYGSNANTLLLFPTNIEKQQNFISFTELYKQQSQLIPKKLQSEFTKKINVNQNNVMTESHSEFDNNNNNNITEGTRMFTYSSGNLTSRYFNNLDGIMTELRHNQQQQSQLNEALFTIRKNLFNKVYSDIKKKHIQINRLNKNIKIFPMKEEKVTRTFNHNINIENSNNNKQNKNQNNNNNKNNNGEGMSTQTSLPKISGNLKEVNNNNNNDDEQNQTALLGLLPNKVYYNEINNILWKPPIRFGATLSCVNSLAYLIGGRNSDCINEISIFQLKTQRWISLELMRKNLQIAYDKSLIMASQRCKTMESDETPSHSNATGSSLQSSQFPSRFSHTACIYKNNIIIFGGERNYNLKLGRRECFNDVWSFDVETLTWKRLPVRGEQLEPRRYHTSTIIGKYMLVIGGMNPLDKILNDIFALDFDNMKWLNCNTIPEVDKKNMKSQLPIDQGIASHATCAVYEDLSSQMLFTPNIYNSSQKLRIMLKEEGIFCFGGLVPQQQNQQNQNQQQLYQQSSIQNCQNKINDKLYILKTGQKNLLWREVLTKGKGPGKRYHHTMNYYKNKYQLIICGGLDDYGVRTIYYNDAFIFNTISFEWIQLEITGKQLPSVAYHCTSLEKSQLLIFGGINLQGFLNADTRLLEIDQAKAIIMGMQDSDKKELTDIEKQVLTSRFKTDIDKINIITFQPSPTTNKAKNRKHKTEVDFSKMCIDLNKEEIQ